MAIISYGKIDKKLFLILLLFIVRGISQIILNINSREFYTEYLVALEEDIGSIIAAIVINFFFKNKNKNKGKSIRSFKYLVILFLLLLVKSGFLYTYFYILVDTSYYYHELSSATNGVEIILISIATFLLLKYKYYIHHIITMLIYCALGISIDLILGNFSILVYKYVYIYIIFIINEVLLYCYLKYMMDKLYYYYTEVILYYGIFDLIIKLFIFSGIIIYEYKNDIDGIIYELKAYFENTNVFIIISFQFLFLILEGSFSHVLIILIIYYLRPNLMIANDEINVYSDIIFYQDNQNKYYTLIPFVLQILALLFYFEILEFNFCNLNINTTKNIQIRVEEESKERQTVSSGIDIDNEYLLDENGFSLNDESDIDKNEGMNSDKKFPLIREMELIN